MTSGRIVKRSKIVRIVINLSACSDHIFRWRFRCIFGDLLLTSTKIKLHCPATGILVSVSRQRASRDFSICRKSKAQPSHLTTNVPALPQRTINADTTIFSTCIRPEHQSISRYCITATSTTGLGGRWEEGHEERDSVEKTKNKPANEDIATTTAITNEGGDHESPCTYFTIHLRIFYDITTMNLRP